ncbi:hypothetical protein [Sphingomonas crocodyli]|uniref:Uncharacterized protein n=1 Tax=Sphingomonas crocodyli TaxID=1979270 RepID=A0A437M7Q0_9SPHN|nr:hypothetical protein [Sphingomonas crocodyli]RVT93712.1 hypothetical protein EOD43_07555 [Sphingomonas crocodyli]
MADADPPRRKPDTGLIRPYRPRPPNFRAVFIRNGWAGPDGAIEEIFNTNWRCIRRWIDEEGRESLIRERAAHVRQNRIGSRRSDYVMGRKLRARQAAALTGQEE